MSNRPVTTKTEAEKVVKDIRSRSKAWAYRLGSNHDSRFFNVSCSRNQK